MVLSRYGPTEKGFVEEISVLNQMRNDKFSGGDV